MDLRITALGSVGKHLRSALAGLVGLSIFPTPALALCPANLPQAIEAIVAQPDYTGARWGIVVETLRTPQAKQPRQVLYSRDATSYFLVASNVKLITTAAGLAEFGPNHRWQTEVFGVGQGERWDWVRLVGRGDASLTTADLEKMAQALYRQGIREINTVEITSPANPNPPLNPTWALEDVQAGYIAPITQLTLDRNSLSVVVTPQALNQPLSLAWETPRFATGWQLINDTKTVSPQEREFLDTELDQQAQTIVIRGQLHQGSKPETLDVPFTDPFPYILNQWRQAVEQAGIKVNQARMQHTDTRPMGPRLISHDSPPLKDLINTINRRSDNLYAETLAQHLAEKQPDLIKQILSRWGLDPATYQLADGSGLSRQNWVQPQALLQLLQAQATSPQWSTFRTSLPQAGINGTLRQRFLNTPAQGQVWAKTGTLRGVSALSGYAYPREFAPLAFSIVVNQANQEGSQLRPGIDRIVLELFKLRNCGP